MACVFCQIVSGEIPTKLLYEDEEVVAFPDINPQAPTHILVTPKKHIPSLTELAEKEMPLLGHMVDVARRLAQEKGLSGGYRIVVNCGEEGGQVIPHLHMHLLGGRKLSDELG